MLRLERGDDSLIVAPEVGAAIVEWTRRGTHLLRRPSPDAVQRGQSAAMGCFPMVPYCNRIAHRRFAWRGRAHELAANFGDHPHAIHGVGWQVPWRTEEVSTDHVTLSLDHSAIGSSALAWPYAFAARVSYRLTEQGFSAQIEVTNLDLAAAPAGIGLHPYFPRAAAATISFHADGVWRNHDALPVTHEPVPPAWDHASGRSADREPLDNCFTLWAGSARIPGMRIEADKVFGALQIFTPAGADFLCVEPVSHVPNAVNRPELPRAQAMTVLASGQTLRGSVHLTPDR